MRKWKKVALTIGPAALAMVAFLEFNPSFLAGDGGWNLSIGVGVMFGICATAAFYVLDAWHPEP